MTIVVLGLLLAWLIVAVGVSSVARERAPQMALRFWPLDSRASARVAELRLEAGHSPSDIADVEGLLRSALARDATYAPAIRTLGLAEAALGHEAASRSLLLQSARLSRRDLPTRLWLIEDRVAANDIPGALRQYDIALRTSDQASNLLFPVLIRASAVPNMVEPLARLLAQRPPWAEEFLPRLYNEGTSLESIAEITRRLAVLGAPPRRALVAQLITRFTDQRQFAPAWSLYRALVHEPVRIDQLRNGGFERENLYPPFDWLVSGDPDVSAVRQGGAGQTDGTALYFSVHPPHGGMVARQVLQLAPGTYRLAAVGGGIPQREPPFWQITCLGAIERPISRLDLPAGAENGTPHRGVFTVPAQGCQAQLLYLNVIAGDDDDQTGWVDDVQIQRL